MHNEREEGEERFSGGKDSEAEEYDSASRRQKKSVSGFSVRDSAFCAGTAAEVWLDEHDDGVLKLSHYHYKIMNKKMDLKMMGKVCFSVLTGTAVYSKTQMELSRICTLRIK